MEVHAAIVRLWVAGVEYVDISLRLNQHLSPSSVE